MDMVLDRSKLDVDIQRVEIYVEITHISEIMENKKETELQPYQDMHSKSKL